MRIICIIGPPLSGKGTQSKLLSSKTGMAHISTGELIRNEIESKTDFGAEVLKYVEAGELESDPVLDRCAHHHPGRQRHRQDHGERHRQPSGQARRRRAPLRRRSPRRAQVDRIRDLGAPRRRRPERHVPGAAVQRER